MELLVLLLVVALGLYGLVNVPFRTWTFPFQGREITVKNHAFHETVFVDGEKVAGTRVGGNWMTWATHAIALPDGDELMIHLASDDGISVNCAVHHGEELVFDSRTAKHHRSNLAPTRAVMPTAGTGPAVRAAPPAPDAAWVPADPRWQAAAVLFADLDSDPQLGGAARDLREALQHALGRLDTARRAADAHTALGGDPGETSPLVADREADVQSAIQVLRELHLAASQRELTATALPHVEEVLQRMQAEKEVNSDLKRRATAARAAAIKKQT